MKFLLDMNVPRELGRRLAKEGHSWRHVADVGFARASDETIVEEARPKGEVIVTHDLDYGRLLAFSGARDPSVIIFRVRNTSARNLHDRIVRGWLEIETPLNEGAVVTIEDAALRIRMLPISKDE